MVVPTGPHANTHVVNHCVLRPGEAVLWSSSLKSGRIRIIALVHVVSCVSFSGGIFSPASNGQLSHVFA